jgi:hypothetical protein
MYVIRTNFEMKETAISSKTFSMKGKRHVEGKPQFARLVKLVIIHRW